MLFLVRASGLIEKISEAAPIPCPVPDAPHKATDLDRIGAVSGIFRKREGNMETCHACGYLPQDCKCEQGVIFGCAVLALIVLLTLHLLIGRN